MMICRLFTHKVTAIPIFLAVMACVFYITFNTAGRLLENMLSFCVDGAAEALSLSLIHIYLQLSVFFFQSVRLLYEWSGESNEERRENNSQEQALSLIHI